MKINYYEETMQKKQIELDLLKTGDCFMAEFCTSSIGKMHFTEKISGNSNPDYSGKIIMIRSNKPYLYLSKIDLFNVVKVLTEDGIAYFEPYKKRDLYYLIKDC